MAGNTYGNIFKISTFGESHGSSIGVVIDGCPAGIEMDSEFIKKELQKRRPGQSNIVTQRKENDSFSIESGVYKGKTTGAPIAIILKNEDTRSGDYDHLENAFRPSHADFTYHKKYGSRDHRGGGRSSARETAARVAAGAIAKLILARENIKITAFTSSIGILDYNIDWNNFTTPSETDIESNPVRCPDNELANKMVEYIKTVRKKGDSCGGRISCIVENVPAGLGEPVFDKLHAELGKAMLSINAVKGFEIGSGFAGTRLLGSQHNDIFSGSTQNEIVTKTNFSGGIQGGISNGMPIYFNVAFKPAATLMIPQESIDKSGKSIILEGRGRHDPCVVPRAVPIVEAMTALVITDFLLRNNARIL